MNKARQALAIAVIGSALSSLATSLAKRISAKAYADGYATGYTDAMDDATDDTGDGVTQEMVEPVEGTEFSRPVRRRPMVSVPAA